MKVLASPSAPPPFPQNPEWTQFPDQTVTPPDKFVSGTGGGFDPAQVVDAAAVQALFMQVVKIPGQSYDERQVADTYLQKIKDMGYDVHEDAAAQTIGGNTGNLIVNIPGTIPDAPPLVFLTHMDTVPLAVGVQPQVKDGYVTGDGSTALGGDDRAGNAELLETLRILKEKNIPHPPLQIIFTVAEEAGLVGSGALDPTQVHGRLGFEADYFRPNQLLWGAEDFNIDGSHIAGAAPRTGNTHPRTADEQFLQDFTAAAITNTGLSPVLQSDDRIGSSDSARLRAMGIPALIIGAGEQNPHTVREFLRLDDLATAEQLIFTIIGQANQFKMAADGTLTQRQPAA